MSLTGPVIGQDQVSEAPAEVAAADPKPVAVAPILPVDVDPALWVLKDDDTTIYLFGTVHVLKPGLSWFDEAVKEAFDRSDTLVMEMIEPDNAQMQAELFALALDGTGKPLRSRLSADQQKTYDAALTKLKMPIDSLDPVKPWFGGVTLEMTNLLAQGYDIESGVETGLTKAAKAAKKKILGLETFSGQLRIFDGVSEKSQIAMLVAATENIVKGADETQGLVDMWGKPDPEGLARLMNEGLTDPELRSKLLTRRNANWASWINKRMAKRGTLFIAVGAGHLSGEDSVQALLKAYHLETARVPY